MAKIYESPDGGKTIYVREGGSTERELYSIDPETAAYLRKMAMTELWDEIITAADTNPALQEELNRVIIFYRLLKNE